ncbi:LptF/LptG family permease [Desulfovibrio sp. OttesenSCG-928-C06]|nr:LptF/LptG family permease [Desulfovibrio sp. OttesenSCG-928-C06]
MTLLSRYLLKRNLFLLLVLLGIGTGIYILSELFQRIDVFLDAGHGAGMIALYFLVKLPIIISRILPAIFLLGLVLQFSLMNRSRETIALEAGGVSPSSKLKFVLAYGLILGCMQFAFAQFLGVAGERYSTDLWQNQVKKRTASYYAIESLWFTKGPYVVHLEKAWPNSEEATGVTIYELTDGGQGIERIFRAPKAKTGKRDWVLENVSVVSPGSYVVAHTEKEHVPVLQDLNTFKTFEPKSTPAESTISDLMTNIRLLEEAGTNVEILRTEFHGRFAYSASLVVMSILGLVITMRTTNLYVGVLAALVCTFFYFILSSFFSSMGESGTISPIAAAWTPDAIFFLLSAGYLAYNWWKTMRRKL